MFHRVLSRAPTERELERLIALAFIAAGLTSKIALSLPKRFARLGNPEADASLSAVELAAYTSLGRVVLQPA